MKILITCFALILLTTSCSSHSAKATLYNVLHEKQRQDCILRGQQDCPRVQKYETFKKERDRELE